MRVVAAAVCLMLNFDRQYAELQVPAVSANRFTPLSTASAVAMQLLHLLNSNLVRFLNDETEPVLSKKRRFRRPLSNQAALTLNGNNQGPRLFSA